MSLKLIEFYHTNRALFRNHKLFWTPNNETSTSYLNFDIPDIFDILHYFQMASYITSLGINTILYHDS